jgi:AcrR family transcriptional regulator
MARAGRRPGPTRTKEAILGAARAQFAQRGYAATTVRSVAAGAGVNPALVHHHFGRKEELFLAALALPVNPAEVIGQLLAEGPREEFGDRLARYFVGAWRDPVIGLALQAVLRRAVSDEDSAALLRNLAENVLLDRAASLLGVPKLRIAAAMSHLVGLALAATILRIEPLASASADELAGLIGPAIRGYLN